ncbi:MAG TPA: hypothetical protein VGL11_20855 [Candidatus Binatia bacterium]
MEHQKISGEKPSFWQQVFLQSKVNGAPYFGDSLPGQHWNWPKDSYLKRKLKRVRSRRSVDEFAVSPYDFAQR